MIHDRMYTQDIQKRRLAGAQLVHWRGVECGNWAPGGKQFLDTHNEGIHSLLRLHME